MLTRLALALLAVLGFVAPLSAAEGDSVVQTAGGKPAPGTRREVVVAAAPAEVEGDAPLPVTSLPRLSVERVARRYLLNRAWLV